MDIPEGYILIPKEVYNLLVQQASYPMVTLPTAPTVYNPETHMPICGCKIGSACGNVTCPHLPGTTCWTIGESNG